MLAIHDHAEPAWTGATSAVSEPDLHRKKLKLGPRHQQSELLIKKRGSPDAAGKIVRKSKFVTARSSSPGHGPIVSCLIWPVRNLNWTALAMFLAAIRRQIGIVLRIITDVVMLRNKYSVALANRFQRCVSAALEC